MASPERSPKRQRLSPPGDEDQSFVKSSGADSAYGSTTASQVNGITSKPINPEPQITGPVVVSTGQIESDQPSSEARSPPAGTRNADDSAGTVTVKVEGDGVAADAEHRRTDHERQDASRISTIEELPLLCQKPHPRSRPHPSQDLISIYTLSALAASVARRDPTTGAKINKLRKSYEGKIKSQNLPGRNKPTTLEGELMGLMEWPEEGWYDQRVYGRELEVALDPVKGRLWRQEDGEGGGGGGGGGRKGKVERALTLAVGRLPRQEDEKWRAAIGLDEAGPTKAPAKNSVSAMTGGGAANGLLRPGQGTGMRASAPASPAGRANGGADRPDRAGKKRRYDDASFEGYDGGWAEDDGYSTGDGKMGRKKRRVGFEFA